MRKKLLVSFDFDGTITTREAQKIAQDFMSKGHEVCIITKRKTGDGFVHRTARNLGINRVYFTNMEPKWKTILDLGVDLHYDDEQWELDLITFNTNTKTILIR